MKRSARIGIIIAIISILSIVSIGTLSQIDDFKKNGSESTIEDENNQESKPIGRDLSVEFEENMGLSAP